MEHHHHQCPLGKAALLPSLLMLTCAQIWMVLLHFIHIWLCQLHVSVYYGCRNGFFLVTVIILVFNNMKCFCVLIDTLYLEHMFMLFIMFVRGMEFQYEEI